MNIQGIYHATPQNWANPMAAKAISDEESEVEPNGFVARAATLGTASIEAAEIALQQSPSADIRAFALRAMVEHSRTRAELQALACRKYLHGGDEAMSDHSIALGFQPMETEGFDPAYANGQVMVQARMVELLALAAREIDDLELEQFASTTLPTFRQLLKTARALADAHPLR